MRLTTLLNGMNFSLLAALCLGCGGGAVSIQRETFFSYTSDPGDPIGAGASGRLTPTTPGFWHVSVHPDRSAMDIQILTSLDGSTPPWLISVSAPDKRPLEVGTYALAERFPFQSTGHPGISVIGPRGSSSTISGSFVVRELVVGADGTVERLDMTFEQHSDGAVPALRGEISIGQRL